MKSLTIMVLENLLSISQTLQDILKSNSYTVFQNCSSWLGETSLWTKTDKKKVRGICGLWT